MKVLALLCLCVSAIGVCHGVSDCKPPTTDLVVQECMANPIVQFDSKSIVLSPYPPKPDQDINITISYTNTGPAIDDFSLEIGDIYFYGNILFKCGWHVIYKGPLTLNGCKTVGCPINAGVTNIKGKLDLTKFAGILSLLGGDKYFKFDLKFLKTDKTELTCATVQMYLLKD